MLQVAFFFYPGIVWHGRFLTGHLGGQHAQSAVRAGASNLVYSASAINREHDRPDRAANRTHLHVGYNALGCQECRPRHYRLTFGPLL